MARDGRVGSWSVDLDLPPVTVAHVAASVVAEVRGDADAPVTGVAYDSRHVSRGDLFCCIPGERYDGHAFAAAAVDAGATALLVERSVPVEAPQIVVASVRAAMGPVSAAVFGAPASAMTMLGITGTNGKTTTTLLLTSILRAAGRRAAALGTTGIVLDGATTALPLTTPEAPDLHRVLAGLRADGVEAVAMEVSSHALAFERVGGVTFDVAAFTNLSHDHLDLHGSMDRYFDAKARLFEPDRARRGAVNADDRWGRRLLDAPAIPLRSFGVASRADRVAADVEVGPGGSAFTLDGRRVTTRLLGSFNVSNALCALTVAELAGVDADAAVAGLAEAPAVPGRLEPIDEGQGFLVMVDYAHTPDSIQHVLRGARPLSTGRTIVVFGCGGDRDRAKRPRMGRVATAEADLTVITTDNPRHEDPLAIIDEIASGAREGGGAWVVEADRRAAIALAIGEARGGDVVVIAGKGHETTQQVGDGEIPFDDRVEAREALRAVGRGG
jgi:UDP-N-acetylmuramoyl-L-alanyl-D-glutamate--2,6-diaminopimelate ligase